jgi:hypothetical protein
MLHPETDPNAARHAAGIAEKISRSYPELLRPYANELIDALPRMSTPIMRWHLALLLSYLPLADNDQLAEVINNIQTWLLNDQHKFAKVHYLQALANISKHHYWLKPETILLVKAAMAKGGAAANARGRMLLRQLER